MEIGCYRGLRHRRGLPGRRPEHQDERAHPQGPKRMQVAGKKKAGRSRCPAPEAPAARPPQARRRTSRSARPTSRPASTTRSSSLTDREGNVIAWESAGGAGFKGSRKSTPFAAQVTADAAARKGMEQGLQKVEVFVKGPGLRPRDGDPLAAGRRPRGHRESRTSRRRPTTAAAPASGAGSEEAGWHATQLPSASSAAARAEALPQGRALPDRQVRRRAARLPARRPRPRPPEAVRVPRPAAREAEGAPLLRRAREAVPQLLRQGVASPASPARTCCAARARFDNVLVRLGFAASRRQARQLIRHGHWTINGRRVDIPTYQVREAT